jgi:anti-anti-sigma factor
LTPCWYSFETIVSFSEEPPVLRCSGDEDRTTQSLRRRALSRALQVKADLVVDLTELHFADASLMVDLAMIARRLRKAERGMRVCGAQPHIQRLIEMVGLHRLPGVTVESPAIA